MIGRPAAPWAGSARLVVALGMVATVGSGCSQLLGITDITAGDGAVADFGSSDVASGSEPGNTDAAACTGDLSNIHSGDFLISFRMQTIQSDKIVALVNQRIVCTLSAFWDVQLVDQQIFFELSESTAESGYTFITSTGPPLNDGMPHDVVVTRTKWVAQIVIDGKVATAGPADQDLGKLPPLVVADDVCVGGSDGTVKLRGSVTNICVRPN